MSQKHFKKTSKIQFDLLKSEMITHKAAALGYCANTVRSIVDEEWENIVGKLNAIGPPCKSLPEWKKVWSDIRLRSKKRLSGDIGRKEDSDSDDEYLYTTQKSYKSDADHRKLDSDEIIDQYDEKKMTTSEQFHVMKLEMAKQNATNKESLLFTEEWRGIVEKLNDLGPPYRTSTEWKKVWANARLRMNKQEKYCPRRRKNVSESVNHISEPIDNASPVSTSYASHNEDYSEPQTSFALAEVPNSCSNMRLRSAKRLGGKHHIKEELESEDDTLKETSNGSDHQNNISEVDDKTGGNSIGKKYTTPEQLQVLKLEMSRHASAASGYAAGIDHSAGDAEWLDILRKLNAVGPPYKTLAEWKKVWSHIRLRLKRRFKNYPYRHRPTNESGSEPDLSMVNSIYSSSNDLDYIEPQIVHEPIDDPPVVDNDAKQYFPHSNASEEHEILYNKPAVFPENYRQSEAEESQYGQNDSQQDNNDLLKQTLQAMQALSEQNSRILQKVSHISSTMSSVLGQHIKLLERRNQIMEQQRTISECRTFFQRRQELRSSRKRNTKIN